MPPAKKPKSVSILERRRNSPFGSPSAPIDLKEKGWVCRWFNATIAPDHVWRKKNDGWEGVVPDDLVDANQIGGYSVTPDGFVARGHNGSEVLLKMPKEWVREIAKAKTEQNMRNMRPGVTKQQTAEAAGAQFGDEAHDFVQKSRLIGDVVDQYERIERKPVEGE